MVTISVPRGGPLGRPSGAGGGTRFGAVATGFTGLGFDAFAFLAAGFDAAVRAGFAAVADAVVRRAEARFSPPSLVGRVERRLPRTLGSAALLDFLPFFFADFWVTRSWAEREFPELALRRGTVNDRSGRRPL